MFIDSATHSNGAKQRHLQLSVLQAAYCNFRYPHRQHAVRVCQLPTDFMYVAICEPPLPLQRTKQERSRISPTQRRMTAKAGCCQWTHADCSGWMLPTNATRTHEELAAGRWSWKLQQMVAGTRHSHTVNDRSS